MKNLNKKKRPVCGVVAAEANSIEQRQIIEGIVSQNQLYGIDTAVISNIYNPNVKEQELYCENRIYELILSEDLDSIILISESFVNDELRKYVTDYISRKNVPVVVIGNIMDGLANPNCIYINTSDENDMEDVTNHLIEEHGLKDIHLLTGYDFIKASQLRVQGYKKALESHGIPFDANKVFYGNFWMNSGEDMAEKYADGSLKLPQGIVCANDYMAMAGCDALSDRGIRVPEDVVVTGFDDIRGAEERIPSLTTVRVDVPMTGRRAVDLLVSMIQNETVPDIDYISTEVIKRGSCGCCEESREKAAHSIRKFYEEAQLAEHYNMQTVFMSVDVESTTSMDELNESIYTYIFNNSGVRDFFLVLNDREWGSVKPADGHQRVVGVAPFAQHKGKIWPLEQMERLVEMLSEKGYRVVLFGSGSEAPVLETWAGKYEGVESLAGRYGFAEELERIAALDVMVSMDSANMHFASCLGIPVVSIWGATHPCRGFYGWKQDPAWAVQKEMDCRPCSKYGKKPCQKGDYPCLKGIEPIEVMERIEGVLSGRS